MPSVLLFGSNSYINEDLSRRLMTYGDIDRVSAVSSVEDAKALMKREAVDVLIAQMDAAVAEAIERVSELWAGSGVRVILVADAMTDEAISRAVNLGVTYCMLRPVSACALHDRAIMVHRSGARAYCRERKAAPGLENRINRLLNGFGLMPNCIGYHYLFSSVILCARRQGRGKLMLTKEVYPRIAAEYNTSRACVERAERACIQCAWEKRSLSRSDMTRFSERPTNGLFIAVLTQLLSEEGE